MIKLMVLWNILDEIILIVLFAFAADDHQWQIQNFIKGVERTPSQLLFI